MTEYDTFLKLKQIPYDNMIEKITASDSDMFNKVIYENFDLIENDFLNERGWTELEFKKTFLLTIESSNPFWLSLLKEHIADLERKYND